MKSLKNLYRIGRGPSSSHTMGPQRAVLYLRNKYKTIKSAKIILYGSLSFTGKGHLIDKAILDALKNITTEIVFDYKTKVSFPNTFDVILTLSNGEIINKRVLSLGGGAISISGELEEIEKDIYPEKNFKDVVFYCKNNGCSIPQYVEHYEGKDIWDYLLKVWRQMCLTIENGLKKDGFLPGKLNVARRASSFLKPLNKNETTFGKANRLIAAYAFSTNEENASGEIIVTAPTCGSSGTLPSVLKYLQDKYSFSNDKIIQSLAVAGVIGNVVKQNASISGAEAGCQAEIGTACSMAAGAAAYLMGFNIDQIEYAAEAAMEHSLGLTCDPVGGYVQIPCIERNAVAAIKALAATNLAEYAFTSHRVSFDTIVNTMYETGKDLNKKYRETSKGGLAVDYMKALKNENKTK